MTKQQANPVKARRQAKGLNQTELANACGLSQGAISQIETGRVALSLKTALALSKALDCPVEKLL